MSIFIKHVKDHYRLLNHEKLWSQVHAQDKQKDKTIDRRLLFGQQQVVAWVKEWNGKGDLYIGRNPRSRDGKVEKVTNVFIDIDPIRQKDSASTPEELQRALDAGKFLLSEDFYSRGVVASSGNGCHIYWPLKETMEANEDTQFKIKQFESELRDKLGDKYHVQLDAMHDHPRLVKIIGTQATKGEPHQRRVSRFLHPIDWTRLFDERVCERIQSYPTPQQLGIPTAIPKTDDVDRSKLDYGLALRLKQDGATPDDIRTFLSQHGYKAGERPDDINRIITKLFSDQQRSNTLGTDQQVVEIYSPATHFEEYEKELASRGTKPDAELSTGIPTLDGHTNGLKKGNVWVVGARTGIGKTSFSITIATHLLKMGKRVLFFSTEMSGFDIFNRFISVGSGVSLFDLERGKLSQADKELYKEYRNQFQQEALFICDKAEPNIRDVSETMARTRPDAIIFDHIQRIANSRDKRYLELSGFIKGLNTLCREYHCAGIVNSQLNRIAEQEVPALHHLKECGSLEEEAHAVILLSLMHKDQESSMIVADLAKNRGPKGQVTMKFDRAKTLKFEEI